MGKVISFTGKVFILLGLLSPGIYVMQDAQNTVLLGGVISVAYKYYTYKLFRQVIYK